jgi:hypothetical protein
MFLFLLICHDDIELLTNLQRQTKNNTVGCKKKAENLTAFAKMFAKVRARLQ